MARIVTSAYRYKRPPRRPAIRGSAGALIENARDTPHKGEPGLGNTMRKRRELQKRDGTRLRCRAVVERFGTKNGYRGPEPTILLRNVVDADIGTLLTEHLWFTCGKWSASLTAGDTFEFEARAADYIKGYQGHREVYDAPVRRDWKLQRPTKVTILTRPNVAAAPR